MPGANPAWEAQEGTVCCPNCLVVVITEGQFRRGGLVFNFE
jgi:hypothetical protein